MHMVRFSQLNLIKNRVTILLHQILDPVTPHMENLGENRVTLSMLVIVGTNHSGKISHCGHEAGVFRSGKGETIASPAAGTASRLDEGWEREELERNET
jgi:hypothetical protein